jgi:UDP-N-acetylglucosamine--N-acetylmuramyl-(pentapeptide) pyrophosphoryl-undecaprenol N-acetylglucosamine transferase
MSKKFIIAGGGTGGHIFPAIAIANAIKLQMPDAEFLFVGAKGKMEMEKVPQAGFKIVGLDIAGYNRSSLIKNIALPFKLIKSFFQVRKILSAFKPDGVIGVGGYSSFPVLKSAQAKGIPTFIHESNAFAGKSNTMLGKNATKIFVATSGMQQFFPAEKLVVSGNPVRKTITDKSTTRDIANRFFGLDDNKTTVLSIGGSLGANSINKAVEAGLEQIADNNLQLIWQTGKPFYEQAKIATANYKNVWAKDFIKEMEMAYAAADIIISRAGAMSVAEICVAAKPVVFVPYPFAAEDHQTHNAKVLAQKNAAKLINDSNVNEQLIDTVIAIAKNKQLQEEMKQNIAKEAIVNADLLIANEIIKCIR